MAYSDKELLRDEEGNVLNQVYDPVNDEFVELTEDILDFSIQVDFNPQAEMLRDEHGDLMAQAYDPDKKKFVPLTNDTFLYYGGEK